MIKHQSKNQSRYRPYLRAFYAVSIAIAILTLGGCGSISNPLTKPAPLMLETTVDYGPPEFRLAYEDGCKSALSAYGNNMMKTMYTLQKRPEYQYSNMYNQVWRDAWNYCYMWYFTYGRRDILYGENWL